MIKAIYEFKKISISEMENIKELFKSVFTADPWNDDWSNEKQLDLYINDVAGQENSLSYGIYEGEKLIGISMGHVKHWYSGTEYYIEELCIQTEKQGSGIGSFFMSEIESSLKKSGIQKIFLQTESDVPAYSFYQKKGFIELKNHVSFVKGV